MGVRILALATLRVVVSVLRAQLSRILGTEPPAGVDGVGGVTHDSRLVEPGFAFVAIPGFRRDGTEFVPEALRRGAALIVAERGLPPGVPAVVVPDAGRRLRHSRVLCLAILPRRCRSTASPAPTARPRPPTPCTRSSLPLILPRSVAS